MTNDDTLTLVLERTGHWTIDIPDGMSNRAAASRLRIIADSIDAAATAPELSDTQLVMSREQGDAG
ncbi:hypothetical protein [Rhodococcus artemisiae]|uniref:Uncharacterized protein n=1 Tax=Rhodococcus artemisiae TaxID=714159 RepID=A0ABU7L4Y6_9NOCA|nr:hypothetical protein [Rhodococcus artemisiae]MEE2056599.1 hypothetical protein [Rhodococcus artemisiae]